MNSDPAEIKKFETLAHQWWDPYSEFRPLHEINPLRLGWIQSFVSLTGKKIVDVGCGGGLLTEAMAACGATVKGIDLSEKVLQVAQLHSLESGISVDYEKIAVEELAQRTPETYDIVTCMEMLEHVPAPASIVSACAKLAKPGGKVFFSTINRNLKSYLFAVIGAEYILRLLPKQTHNYEKFIKPSELSKYARDASLDCEAFKGLSYNLLLKEYFLTNNLDVNYLLFCEKK